jgi:hypothetical protein
MRRGLPGFHQAARRFLERLNFRFAFIEDRFDLELPAYWMKESPHRFAGLARMEYSGS